MTPRGVLATTPTTTTSNSNSSKSKSSTREKDNIQALNISSSYSPERQEDDKGEVKKHFFSKQGGN